MALRSLGERPDDDTPAAIASVAPLGLSAEDIAAGLRELGERGLAASVGGHWSLTGDLRR